MNELDEFYPYIEVMHVAQSPSRFQGSFDGGASSSGVPAAGTDSSSEWTSATLQRRRDYVERQLEFLESPITETRRGAQGRLLYLMQGKAALPPSQRSRPKGCFAETTSPEMQLHWIIENAKLIRAVDGVATLVYSLRDAASRYDSTE